MGTRKQRNRPWIQWTLLLSLVLVGGGLLISPSLVIQGVPMPIIIKFLKDKPARDAYFSENSQALHDRLDNLGVEAEMKAFYRPQIRDEVKLDQHVHQIFYDATGYVGKAYQVSNQGQLVLKHSSTAQFDEWFQLAYQAGVVVASKKIDGVQHVTSPEGVTATYEQIAAIYPKSFLKQLIQQKQAQ